MCLNNHNLTRKKGNSLKLENANNNKNSENQKRSHGFFIKGRCLVKIACVQLPKLHLMMSFQMMLKNMFLMFISFFLKYSLGD